MGFSGQLTAFSIGSLLQWAHGERRTGILEVRRAGCCKRLYFDSGQLVGCLSDRQAERFGRTLLLKGCLDEQALARSLDKSSSHDLRFGLTLMLEERLNLTAVRQSLRQHIEELVCDIFLWRGGSFYFYPERVPGEEILPEPIDLFGLQLTGTQWRDEYARMREVLRHDGLVLERLEAAALRSPIRPRLEQPRYRKISSCIDGTATLLDVYCTVGGSYYLFLEAVFEMHRAGLVTAVDGRDGGGLTAADLYEEREAESSEVLAGPLALFQHYVPIWVKDVELSEWDGVPPRIREILFRFDGTRRLADVLGDELEARPQVAELLMTQVARGTLAFLPVPVAELSEPWAAAQPLVAA